MFNIGKRFVYYKNEVLEFVLYPNIDIEEQEITGFTFRINYVLKTKGEKDEFSEKNVHVIKKLSKKNVHIPKRLQYFN